MAVKARPKLFVTRSWFLGELCGHDSLGRAIEARYVWIEGDKLAIMQMSEVAGMHRLSESEARSTSRDHVWRWRNAA
jgi:glycerate kinase